MNHINQIYDQFFPLEQQGNFGIFISFLEKVIGHRFTDIKFVTAEDNETIQRHRKFYQELKRYPYVKIDQREFKYKSASCRCKQEIRWKVQAEVDVAIAVYLIDYALCHKVETITLFAGDRDFIDAIMYSKNKLQKNVTIMAFEENLSSRIKSSGVDFINITNNI